MDLIETIDHGEPKWADPTHKQSALEYYNESVPAYLKTLEAEDRKELEKLKQVGWKPNKPVDEKWRLPVHASKAWGGRFESGALIMNPYSVGKTTVTSGKLIYAIVTQVPVALYMSERGWSKTLIVKRPRVQILEHDISYAKPLPAILRNNQVTQDAINAAYADAFSGAVDIAVQLAELPETLALHKTLKATLREFKRLKAMESKLSRKLNSANNRYDKAVWAYDSATIRNLSRVERELSKARAFLTKAHKMKSKHDIASANPFRAGSAASLIVDMYMLWRFAIRPLILSAESLANDMEHKRRRFASFMAPRSVSTSDIDDYHVHDLINGSKHARVNQSTRGNVRIRGHQAFGKNVQTYTSNVPLALWERIPYSWAFDRFIHIGNILATASRPVNLAAFVGCTSTKLKCEQFVTLEASRRKLIAKLNSPELKQRSVEYEQYAVLPDEKKYGGATLECFDRAIVPEPPRAPALNYSTWHFAKAMDLIGLLTQLTRRKS